MAETRRDEKVAWAGFSLVRPRGGRLIQARRIGAAARRPRNRRAVGRFGILWDPVHGGDRITALMGSHERMTPTESRASTPGPEDQFLEKLYAAHHRRDQSGGERLGQAFLEEGRARLFDSWIETDKDILDLGCRDGTLTLT